MLTQLCRFQHDEQIEASLAEALSHFSCKKDIEVENFLKYQALNFEKRGLCRTYIDVDSDILFTKNKVKIDGFFSLAICNISFEEQVSRSMRNRIADTDNFVAPAYLIGQIARHDNSTKGYGQKLITDALLKIREAKELVGGKLLVLDCRPELVQYYQSYGFKQFRMHENGYHQLYLHI